MIDHEQFLQRWAEEDTAQPLVLTGSTTAISDALEFTRTLFSATDIYFLQAEEKTISIESVRAMRQVATQSAWSGRRLVVISEAEKLSGTAVQALLKILEEPGPSTRFILTTRWYRRLLPTIRSRCLQVRLTGRGPMQKSADETIVPSSLMARLAAFSGDTPLTAETLVQISTALEGQLRTTGPTPALRAAYMRLREYYLISSFPGGNQKLARDVLLASLPS